MREIQIPPKPAKTRYGCDFCKKTTARKATMERHEAMCYYNPDRICPVPCCEDGVISYDDFGYGYPDGVDIKDCEACKTADEIREYMGLKDSIERKDEFESNLVV